MTLDTADTLQAHLVHAAGCFICKAITRERAAQVPEEDDPELDAYAASFNPARHADQGLRFNPDGSLILEDGS